MLHCPLSFNHVFHRNLFPLSQRGELREKRCGLLPNRGKLYFLQRGGREEERMDGFPTTKETRNAVREKERKKRGKMARDTGGIIVTSKTRDTPLLPPPQFSSKRTRRKVSSLVSVAHALEIVADPAKKKNSPTSSTTVDPQPTSNIRELDLLRTASSYDFVPGSSSPRFPRGELASLARPFCSREQRTHPWRRVVSRSRTGYTRRRRSKVAGSRVASFQRNSIGRLPSRSSAALSLPVEFTSIYCARVVVDRPRSSVYPRLDLEISIPCLFIRGLMRATRDRFDILGHTRRSEPILSFSICHLSRTMDWEE